MTVTIPSAIDGSPLWIPDTTLAILRRAVTARPDAVALRFDDRTLRYRDYAHCVDVLADRLATLGAAGRPVAIVLGNGMAICLAILAAQAAGAAAATLNPDYTAHELAPLLAGADPAVVIGDAQGCAGAVPTIPVADDGLFVAELLAAPPPVSRPPPDPDSIAVLQFTGGTTGVPKGVLLTHRAVAINVAQREAALPTTFGDERVICVMPLFHVFATSTCMFLAAYAAGELIILPRYRPDTVLDAIERFGATRLPAGPTVFASLLGFEGLADARLDTLRCCYSGSAPLSAATLERWEALTGVPIFEGYGQSEAGPVLTFCGPTAPPRTGSVGRPLPLTEIRIVDVDTAAPLASGEPGEIVARGPQVMRGYLNDQSATDDALRGNWLFTGDIGRLDRDGYLRIEDRKKDMAIVSGYNVFPREVDETLMRHPGVAEVASIGVPDAYRGEVIWAFVRPHDDAQGLDGDAVERWCADRLVKYKRPVVRIVDALPRTAVGKIDKVALRAAASKAC